MKPVSLRTLMTLDPSSDDFSSNRRPASQFLFEHDPFGELRANAALRVRIML
jgi:hypothetical protein